MSDLALQLELLDIELQRKATGRDVHRLNNRRAILREALHWVKTLQHDSRISLEEIRQLIADTKQYCLKSCPCPDKCRTWFAEHSEDH